MTDEDIVPVETFIAYGQWFQQKLVPELEQVRVVSVDRSEQGFQLKLDSGESFTAQAVVVATGLSGFSTCPRSWPPPHPTDPPRPARSPTAPSTTTSPATPARS